MNRIIKTAVIASLTVCMSIAFSMIALAADNVLTVSANGTTTSVTAEGTTDNNVLAVVIEVFDAGNNIVAMQTASVMSGAYSDTFSASLTEGATYTVYVANFAGTGTTQETTFTVPVSYRGGGSVAKTLTYSRFWKLGANGQWTVTNGGQTVKNAWLCDDAVAANGNSVWYLLGADGTMVTANLVQDATGNYYSLEDRHNGYYGSLRYKNGYYNCGGQQIYIEFEQTHNGSFGAIKNKAAIDALKAIYGVTTFGINNSNCVYTKTFK